MVVVDDNSPDQTAKAVQSHPAFNRRVHLVKREGKLGLGSAYKEGFRWAMERGFDTCIQIDADLSHDPADIPRLLEALENGADVAIGSRYSGGVRVMNWPQERLFLSLGASRFVRALTGLPLTDVTSGFKAIRCAALRNLDWEPLHHRRLRFSGGTSLLSLEIGRQTGRGADRFHGTPRRANKDDPRNRCGGCLARPPTCDLQEMRLNESSRRSRGPPEIGLAPFAGMPILSMSATITEYLDSRGSRIRSHAWQKVGLDDRAGLPRW